MNASGRRWVGAVVIFTAVAGCARTVGSAGTSASDLSGPHASPVASPSASRVSEGIGTITGVARTYGGPMMSNGQMADNGNPWSGLTLTATQNGRVISSVVTGSDGGYRFVLPPGSYVVKGCADATIAVVAEQVVHQDISCPVP